MIRLGKKFLKPHFCPECGRLVILVLHPASCRCKKCRNKHHRKSCGHKTQQREYRTSAYRRKRTIAIHNQPYCALCGCTEHLTCHHAVRVKTGEWKGRHLTVLCNRCHQMWETKVSKLRMMEKS